MQPPRRSAMHQSRMLSIGVDVPKASMAMVYGAKGDHAEVTALGTIGTRPGALALRILKRVVGYFASLAHTAEGLIDQNSPLLSGTRGYHIRPPSGRWRSHG